MDNELLKQVKDEVAIKEGFNSWEELQNAKADRIIRIIAISELKTDAVCELYSSRQREETLEAYNRECKRVDELTEEVERLKVKKIGTQDPSIIQFMEEKTKRIQELEGLLREITASFDANDDYRFTNVKIKRMLNLL